VEQLLELCFRGSPHLYNKRKGGPATALYLFAMYSPYPLETTQPNNVIEFRLSGQYDLAKTLHDAQVL
jgi:hypothetical protein